MSLARSATMKSSGSWCSYLFEFYSAVSIWSAFSVVFGSRRWNCAIKFCELVLLSILSH